MYFEKFGYGPPIILIHGGIDTGRNAWEKLIPFLSQKFTIYVPDSRGHGRSNNPSGKINYKLMAEDYIEFIEQEGMVKPIIIGHSDGGQIALEMGMNYNNLKTIILYGVIKGPDEVYMNGMEAFGMYPDRIDWIQLKKLLGSYYDEMKEAFSSVYGNSYFDEYIEKIWKLWTDKKEYLYDEVDKIKVKTIIIQGDRDGFTTPEHALDLYRTIANSQLCIVPKAGHALPSDNAERFYHYLSEHL